MTYPEHVVELTQNAYDALFRTARAVPADKLEWKPLDNGRTVLSQVQECANMPRFIEMILKLRAMPPVSPEDMARERAAGLAWTTVEQCQEVAQKHLDAMFEAMRAFPQEELGSKITLPFGGGMTLSFAQIMHLPCANASYHAGQINYIQTLYGDFEMH